MAHHAKKIQSGEFLTSMYIQRRSALLATFRAQNPDVDNAILVLVNGWHQGIFPYVAESSCWYYTGVEEPGVILTIESDGKSTLYIPALDGNRSDWLASDIRATPECARRLGIDVICLLGDAQNGYESSLYASRKHYQFLLDKLEKSGTVIYSLLPLNYYQYPIYRAFWQHLATISSITVDRIRDVSLLVARQRSVKTKYEIEQLYKAVEITMVAQDAAASAIQDRMTERDIKAGIEYVFAQDSAIPAFPSIVASGPNGTVLHYHGGERAMRDGDLVVVDIGARYGYYSADITRTYPVSGRFSARQKELYQEVLEVHEYIASRAKPGMWLRNPQIPEKSLHHLAVAAFEKRGLAQYFKHGIGHYLGIDVHDVGDYTQPLQEGQVFTIEPGLYLAQEGIGIRIEDDYWVVQDGVQCLSGDLPRDVNGVQALACQSLDDEDDE